MRFSKTTNWKIHEYVFFQIVRESLLLPTDDTHE